MIQSTFARGGSSLEAMSKKLTTLAGIGRGLTFLGYLVKQNYLTIPPNFSTDYRPLKRSTYLPRAAPIFDFIVIRLSILQWGIRQIPS